jgi:hypothetical protein
METKVRKSKKRTASQGQHFIETARALGADEDEEVFKAKLGKIAKAKPPKNEEEH